MIEPLPEHDVPQRTSVRRPGRSTGPPLSGQCRADWGGMAASETVMRVDHDR
jgi:hypothetical protein